MVLLNLLQTSIPWDPVVFYSYVNPLVPIPSKLAVQLQSAAVLEMVAARRYYLTAGSCPVMCVREAF